MSDIPEAAVEAARKAFREHAEWRYRQAHNARGTCVCGETLPEKGNIHHEFGRHQMTKVLEAAMPAIRASIAKEIREEAIEHWGHPSEVGALIFYDAAEYVEGTNHD